MFESLGATWMERSFWTLNDEMQPACKVTMVREIDATALDLARSRAGAEKPSYTALVVAAAARTLKEHPQANRVILGPSFWTRLIQFHDIDITVSIEKDVVGAPCIAGTHTLRCADVLTPFEITGALRTALTTETPRLKLFLALLRWVPPFLCKWILRLSRFSVKQWIEHRGGACFVNSPAKYGVDLIVADMPWPLTFTFGEVRERPIVIEGRVEARRTVPLTMIFDRRIMQGAKAARMFRRFCQLLELGAMADGLDPERPLSFVPDVGCRARALPVRS